MSSSIFVYFFIGAIILGTLFIFSKTIRACRKAWLAVEQENKCADGAKNIQKGALKERRQIICKGMPDAKKCDGSIPYALLPASIEVKPLRRLKDILEDWRDNSKSRAERAIKMLPLGRRMNQKLKYLSAAQGGVPSEKYFQQTDSIISPDGLRKLDSDNTRKIIQELASVLQDMTIDEPKELYTILDGILGNAKEEKDYNAYFDYLLVRMLEHELMSYYALDKSFRHNSIRNMYHLDHFDMNERKASRYIREQEDIYKIIRILALNNCLNNLQKASVIDDKCIKLDIDFLNVPSFNDENQQSTQPVG